MKYIVSLIIRTLIILIIFLIVNTIEVKAQGNVSCKIIGTILDDSTHEPIQFCNVFLANTTRGAASDNNGKYEIDKVPGGSYTLVISHIGYDTKTFIINLLKSQTVVVDVKLKQVFILSKEIQITANEPTEWKNNLKIFEREFLGTDYYSRYCKILNPEIINFKYDSKTEDLTATADSSIRVENDAAGYMLDIILVKFDFNENNKIIKILIYPKFRELRSNDEDEKEKWQKNRKEIYTGSLRHFLSAVARGKVGEEGFKVMVGSFDNLVSGFGMYLDPDSLRVVPVGGSSLKRFYINNCLKISYLNILGNTSSILKPNVDSFLIDNLGNIYNLNPIFPIDTYGYWLKARVSHSLPLDYNFRY